MDANSWPQGFQEIKQVNSKEDSTIILSSSINTSTTCTRPQAQMLEKKAAARPQEQLNCPRCNSTNTKFCYYNNYSLTQPRYFCKTCRRYWTEGGSLRNVPVGGGSRKNKRSSPSPSSSSSSSLTIATSRVPDLNPPSININSQFSHSRNPNNNNSSSISSSNMKGVVDDHHHHHQGQDLNLSFPPTLHENQALELLRSGIASRGLSSFIPTPLTDSNTVLYPSSGFHGFQDFKPPPTFSFAVDQRGVEVPNRYAQEDYGAGRILFPFGDHGQSKQLSSNIDEVNDEHQQNKGQHETTATTTSTTATNTTLGGYTWNGLLGGGSNW